MTDVPVAPPSAAPSTSPPMNNQPNVNPSVSHEVPINESPTSRPNPIGSQAIPDQPDKSQVKHDRDPKASIKAAFDRAASGKVDKPAERPAPKPAEAKAGHNQPPEETEKLDLKKRPGDIPRGERGQFAPRAANQAEHVEHVEQTPPGKEQIGDIQSPYKRLPPHAPFAEPPGRIAEHARRDWADTPETVRGEVHRMHAEFNQAYQHYRGAAEAFAPVAHFHQMAEQHGTTLEQALTNYTGIERKLRSDVIGGLDTIVNNLGLTDPQTGQRIGLRDIAYHVLSQSPEQLQQVQMGNQQTAASQQIGALYQEVTGLKGQLQQLYNGLQFNSTRSAVDQFAEQHPRIDEKEFGDVVKQEIELGFPLDVAYQRAERLLPATRAAQTGTPSAQTRPPDRSIHGSPDVAPSNGASRKAKAPSRSPEEAVQNALKRMNGHV